jgi:hypothetical protein
MNQNLIPIEFYKQRDLGEKINVTFDFIKQNFKEIFVLMAKTVLPIVAFIAIIPAFFPEFFISNVKQLEYVSPSAPLIMLVYYLGYFAAMLYGQSIINTLMYQKLIVSKEGNSEFFDLKSEINSNVFKIFGTSILAGLVIMGFSLLLIIPGIIVAVMLNYAPTVAVFEKISPSKAISKCWKGGLTNWWSTFGLIIVVAIIVGILNFFTSLPATIFTYISVYTSTSGGEAHGIIFKSFYFLFHTISIFGSFILSSISIIALAFQYGNIKEQKENISINKQISEFENLK